MIAYKLDGFTQIASFRVSNDRRRKELGKIVSLLREFLAARHPQTNEPRQESSLKAKSKIVHAGYPFQLVTRRSF
jgi:hypothetical protein